MPYTVITPEQELEMIKDNYENDLSSNIIQKKYHVSAGRLAKIFGKYGLEIRKNLHRGKYTFDKNFFYEDSQNLAYYLGWMSSDGFVQETTNLTGIEIQQGDIKVLEDIAKAMKYTRPIFSYERKERGNGKFCRFLLENAEVKKILVEKYGIIPQKTYKNFCFNFQNLSKSFWKDYIRGYFDGDGSISKTTSLRFQIDGASLKMILALQQAIQELDPTIKLAITRRDCSPEGIDNKRAIKHILPIFRLYCYGENAKKVFELMYKDAEIYLERKHDKYLQYVNKMPRESLPQKD